VVVDRNFKVQVWNSRAEDLWGLRTEEALEQDFLNLDIGVLIPAVNRRGRRILCHVICTPLFDAQQQGQGVILLMEEREEPPT
jgi:two-component system CheB/CheR fusion protein